MKGLTKNRMIFAFIGALMLALLSNPVVAELNDETVINKVPTDVKKIYSDVQKATKSLLRVENDSLTLEKIKTMMVDDGVDSKMAYERLYRAKKEITVARAGLLNLKTGTILGIDPGNIWGLNILLDIALGLPSNWYAYKKSKHLRRAEKYTYLAVNENLKHLIAELYYGILSQEVVVATADMERKLSKKLLEVLEKKVFMGLRTRADYEKAYWRHFTLENELNDLKSLYNREVSIFSTYIGKDPQEAKSLKLAHNIDFLKEENINPDYNHYIASTLENSNELRAAHYRVKAAKAAKKSSRWSIISLDGFGFGYMGRVRVSKSQYAAEKSSFADMPNRLSNQVFFAHRDLQTQISRVVSDEEIFLNSKNEVERLNELLEFGLTDLEALLKAQIIYLQDFRKYMTGHYWSLVKLDQMERIVQAPIRNQPLSDMQLQGEHNKESFSLTLKQKKRRFRKNNIFTVRMQADEKLLQEIDSVTYKVAALGVEKKSKKLNFKYKFKVKKAGHYTGLASIAMKNGEVVEKIFTIKY